LKLISIALDAVHALSNGYPVGYAVDTVSSADEAALPAGEDSEGVETETALSTLRTRGNLRPTPCIRSAAETRPTTV
jgi:hypothetical protein